ncbi:MAG: hypothetical protein HLUCCA11_09065 [Phormidesmis priestleyi Ana]|uniref:Uncharacterized protein n=1 Tax=Phormidesmis priestleyi Ana TaxID=1666911 RepID=A0A0N8KN69_9CYAN|nr:MAG: hypothetical protein HLUCCA11_09065 [Phormidesmis priestleyi Ana]
MIHRPKPSLLHLAGHLLKLFVIWVFAFTLILFFLMLFGAQPLGDLLIASVGPILLRFGATTVVLIITGVFIESLR